MKKILLAATLFLGGCAASSLLSTWRDPGFQPNAPQKAVVIAVLKDQSIRHRVEDAFVKELQAHNITGVASYSFITDQKIEKEALIQEVNRMGADLVIVSAVVDKQQTDTYVPPTGAITRSLDPSFYGYYSTRWETTVTPGYTVTSQSAISELKAFEVKDEKLVWSATAATLIDGGVSDAAISEFCKNATKSLLKGRESQKN